MGYESQAFFRLTYHGTGGAFSLLVGRIGYQVLFQTLQ
jgi:hypothetical protein